MVVDSIAFMNHLMNSDTNWDKIFHVNDKQSSQVTSKHGRTEITKCKENLKKSEKRKHQQHITNQYEQETD